MPSVGYEDTWIEVPSSVAGLSEKCSYFLYQANTIRN
jgi:hypothetical protein